jgi:CheY-like chemotaxis protein
MPSTNTTILIVEDDPNDILFLKMALEAVGVQNPIAEAKDGKEALDYLTGGGRYADRKRYPLPYLLLLDLKLPHLMGLDLLKQIRQRPELDCLMVIVFTSSSNPADVDEAYKLGANAYLVKPSSFEKLRPLAQSLKDFWLTHNQPSLTFYDT